MTEFDLLVHTINIHIFLKPRKTMRNVSNTKRRSLLLLMSVFFSVQVTETESGSLSSNEQWSLLKHKQTKSTLA